ncbi:lipopolysaccharide biosynthesis protein [Frankia sp. Cpl3]|uniref:lipopolysaccharide biosynthesis protein n=1 Tax=Parafrankia colletiae TaxID=573497 RepID=UPI00210F8922|nr:lipopolysaccharide biosynthesis protein [Parafrankia colletiae]MCK9900284.1 lipopolysaccharide biosynthesis protein [Frankia sp. Cpl3]
MEQGLARRSRRGAAATATAQVWRLFTQFGSTIILARLLTPDSYGLVGMVLAISALADQLTDLGLSQAVIQRRVVTHRQVSALFWINVVVGLSLGVILAAASPLVALFYGHDELVGIALVVAPSYLISGALVQHQALLQRQMKFGSVAARDVIGRTTSIGVAITLAALGAGYWALALMPVSGALARAALVWSACDWRPSRPAKAEGLGPMLRFGGSVAASDLLGYVSRNADNVLVGRFSGPAALGYYSRAYALLLLPLQQVNQPVNMVAIPTLSRLSDQPARYRSYYRAAVFTVSLLALPLVVLMALLADVFVTGLMGPAWDGVVPIFQVLAIAGFAQAISSTAIWLWVSRGRADQMLRLSVVTRPLTVASFFAGLPWGPVGVAWAVSIASVVTAIPMLLSATHGSPVRLFDVVLSITPAALASVVLAAVTLGVRNAFTLAPFAELVVAGSAGATAYVAVVLAVPSWRRRVRGVLGNKGSGDAEQPRPRAATEAETLRPGQEETTVLLKYQQDEEKTVFLTFPNAKASRTDQLSPDPLGLEPLLPLEKGDLADGRRTSAFPWRRRRRKSS